MPRSISYLSVLLTTLLASPAMGSLPGIDAQAAASRLSRAIQFPTVSLEDTPPNHEAFTGLHAHLRESFPTVFSTLKAEMINGYSMLIEWPGQDPALAPGLLLAHQDVVPVQPGTEGEWSYPPFSGAIEDGHIWGRGTMDFKLGVLGILEAAERLLEAGKKPRRNLYLAFGHDEEIQGRGAPAIVEHLKAKGIRLAWVLDEGLFITEGLMPGVEKPVAMVGLSEKGYVSVQMEARSTGGHSSVPPRETAAGQIARAVVALEENPMPARVTEPIEILLDSVSHEMPMAERLLLGNIGITGPLVLWKFGQDPITNALIRTTTAVTMLEGSPKDNVLPITARAVANFRILPGDRVADVLEHVRRAIGRDDIKVRTFSGPGENPSPVSCFECPAFNEVQRAIQSTFPGVLVAPSIMVALTDSRHFSALTDNIYRFSPQSVTSETRERFHGTNECISIESYTNAIRFYMAMMMGPGGVG